MKIDSARIKKLLFSPGPQAVVAALLLLPSCFLLFLFYLKTEELDSLEEQLSLLHIKALHLKQAQEKESLFLKEMAVADHFYLDKYIETATFLEPEIKKLQQSCKQLEENTPSHKRLRFLEESNRLLFTEENVHRSTLIQEAEEKQVHPVEMNDQDLKRVLSLIEGVPISPFHSKENSPQFLIKNFELSKKSLSAQEGVYLINMELLKRAGVKQFHE